MLEKEAATIIMESLGSPGIALTVSVICST